MRTKRESRYFKNFNNRKWKMRLHAIFSLTISKVLRMHEH